MSALTAAASQIPMARGGYHHGTRDGRPNLLLIFTDQQTLRAMSAAGNPWVQTPNMDSLVRFGVRFEKSYCASPICTPARGSLVTGVLPHTHGARFNNMTPSWDTLPRLGKLLCEAGYQSLWGGKWHLPSSYPLSKTSTLSTYVPDFTVLPFYPRGVGRSGVWGLGDDTDPPLAAACENYLRARPGQPFFLSVSLHNPHDICYFPAHPERYPDPLDIRAAPPLPANFAVDPEEPEFIADCRARAHYGSELRTAQGLDEDTWRRYLYAYYRMTERVDAEVGRVLRALDETGLDENTLILFTSDHGDGVAAHRWAAKLSLYEESVSVPFAVTWFGRTRENVVDREHLVSGLDVLPTLCDYAGASVPSACQGRSVRPLVEGRPVDWRTMVVTELDPDPKRPERTGRMLCTGRYKYNLFSYGARNEQLFDLETDPGETVNLAGRMDRQAELDRHRALLRTWMADTNDPFTVLSGEEAG
jgi:arylsulfatase A-like enzyme